MSTVTTSGSREPQAGTGDTGRRAGDPGAMRDYIRNLKRLPRTLKGSIVRHGSPNSDRARSQAVTSNFFMHIMSARIHMNSLRFRTTLGLGVITGVLFLILTITGILLMVYYKPDVNSAYGSMEDLRYVVPTGRFMRNIHRWSAHAMVACVILHMARVFFTGAYKRNREFNWILGMVLFVLTLFLSFTGYLLPWDQLAFWAITIGSNIAQSPREVTDALGVTGVLDIGGMQKELLLGAHYVGQEALTRFYVLHVMILPLALTVVAGAHMWRVRKDGGLARPADPVPEVPAGSSRNPSAVKSWGLMALVKGKTPAVDVELANTVPAFPNALYAIAALSMAVTAVMLLLGYFMDAPLKEMANPVVPENPAKAPWYFLGLQELVSYSAFMGGVGIPGLVVVGLGLIPYLDREREEPGRWFSGRQGVGVAILTAFVSTVLTVAMLVFTVKWGWLRSWEATSGVPQIVITILNPGTVLMTLFCGWSFLTVRRTNSTRMGAIALFTSFLVAFVILTYFATVHRGPNWHFYWWPSLWPAH